MGSPESGQWLAAMADEMLSIIKNDTRTLIDRQKANEVIGSRFVCATHTELTEP